MIQLTTHGSGGNVFANHSLVEGFHPYVVSIPPSRTKRFASTFIMRTAEEWNSLPADVFPENSDLDLFKARVNRHFLALLPLSSCENGSCPPTLSVDVCEAVCGPDLPCQNVSQTCCPTACGGAMCVEPVTKRHFVNLVKPGRCPEYPGGVWICSHTCSGDSDCPRALKCCPNRCGALACQRPEADPPAA